jgi:myo-inositol-hexaphosphate 3-phosphohydrolase
MNIENVKNPRWANAQHTAIDLEVKFAEFNADVVYTASANDTVDYSVALYNAAVTGEYGEIADYQEPDVAQINSQLSTNVTKVTMRQMRLALLSRGKLSDVAGAIAAIADAQEQERVRIEWEYSVEVPKGSAWFQQIATNMGIVGDDYDNLFVEASTL